MTNKKFSANGAPVDPNRHGVSTLNFDMSQNEQLLVGQIVARFHDHMQSRPVPIPYDSVQLTMDLCACHCNGRPLNFIQLLMCDLSDFLRDLALIHLNIDRQTGRLPDNVTLRFQVSH